MTCHDVKTIKVNTDICAMKSLFMSLMVLWKIYKARILERSATYVSGDVTSERKIYRASNNDGVKGRVSSSHIRHTVGILKSRRLQISFLSLSFFPSQRFFHCVRISLYTTARRIRLVLPIAMNRNDEYKRRIETDDDKLTTKLWRNSLRRAVRIIARNIDFRQSMGRFESSVLSTTLLQALKRRGRVSEGTRWSLGEKERRNEKKEKIR